MTDGQRNGKEKYVYKSGVKGHVCGWLIQCAGSKGDGRHDVANEKQRF